MKRRILLLATASLVVACTVGFAELVDKAGFQYDPTQDIYVSKLRNLQRQAGYDAIIDQASAPTGMVIDCEPVQFTYNGKPYMIELWKGQYDLSTGSEIGIYKKADQGPLKWECGEDPDMLYMSYVLKKNGTPIYRRNGVHWWLTGFKPGEYTERNQLVMDVLIDFWKNPGMQAPFVASLRQLGYGNALANGNLAVNGTIVTFTFDRPKAQQPPENHLLVSETQKKNKALCDEYNRAKTDTGVTNNSPESVDKILVKSPELLKSLIRRRL